MKKERIISLMLALTATAMTVRAQEPVRIISSNFPDANFREIVKGNDIDKNQDGWLETGELAAVTTLTVRSKSIESLKGVEHFYKLTTLICDDNRLSSLDVSKITTLKALYCSQNRLTSLDVSKNTALTILYCYSNKLTSLDLSNNKALTALTCYLNRIGHSDMLKLVNSLPTVTNGNFYGISISSSTEKNVLAKSRVEIAQGKGWSVKAKDGSSNVDYEGSDYLIAIDATNFPDENFRAVVAGTDIDKDADGKLSEEEIAAVMGLDVKKKNIASLKGIEFFTALTELYCGANQLTSLDVSKNTALKELNCSNNQLTSLYVNANTAIEDLSCNNNQLKSLNVKNNTALKWLNCSGNQLTSLNVDNNTALTSLSCYNNQLKSLDVRYNTALTKLLCNDNQLTTLDMWKNTAMEELFCENNQLTTLNVSKNTALTKLWCYNNRLKSLDVSNNTVLKYLYCSGNQLTRLNVFTVPAIKDAVENGTKDTSNSDYDRYTSTQSALFVDKTVTIVTVEPEGVAINATNFPDDKFRAVVAGTDIDKDADGYLSDEEIAAVTELDVHWEPIYDLTGVGHFTALTSLNCSYTGLSALDVSKNTELTSLNCSINYLSALDVSNNNKLKVLSCYANRINGESMLALVNSLPTVTGGKLYVLYPEITFTDEENVITESQVNIAKGKGWTVYRENGEDWEEYTGGVIAIDAKNFPDEKFRSIVAGTQIDKDADGYLSTAEIAAVTELFVGMESINDLTGVEHFTALTYLNCAFNYLHSLDVSKNIELTSLNCGMNMLESLDVSNNKKLKVLVCQENKINGESMLALVNSLPTVTGGELYVLNLKITLTVEENVITESQVNIAKGKGWTVYHKNGEDWEEYAGSVVTAIRSIEVSAEENGLWYTLDGRKLSSKPAQKGIYIHNGKIVVK